MSNKGTIAIIVAIVIVIAAVAGCVFALSGNGNNNKVTYELNYEGAPAGESVLYRSGSEITEPLFPDYRVDNTFAGWYLDSNCTKEVKFPYKVEGDAVFYAKWTSGIAAKYFDENFFDYNEYGKAIAKSMGLTTKATPVIVDGEELELPIVSSGYDHFIVADMTRGFDDSYYAVIDFDERKTLFTISTENVSSVMSVNLNECNTEFIITTGLDGMYSIYDLHGNVIGPAEDLPVILLHETVIFDDKCYRFNNDGSISLQFDITSNHIPIAGNGDTFCEFDGMTVDGDGTVHYDTFNILNERFEVIESFEIPSIAVDYVCFYIDEGCYLLQYSIPTQSEDYTFSDNGKRFELESFVVNGITCEMMGVNLDNPAFAVADLMTNDGFAAVLAHDITNVISFYKVDENKTLDRSGKSLWFINPEGNIEKSFSISEYDYQFSVIYPLVEKGKYLALSVIGEDTENPITIQTIVDGSSEEFVAVLANVQITNCTKYFIANAADKSLRYDFNIYDMNGKTVGNFEGKKFINSTNNLLFFEDDSGSLYVFRDGKMSQVDGYKGTLTCGESYYCYGDTTFRYFTEDGTEICESSSDSCYEITTKNGTHFIQVYTVDGVSSVLELTA